MKKGLIILDFGSQYTRLIARRFRELGVFTEILAFHSSLEELKAREPVGLVLSGGPFSVHEEKAPQAPVRKLMDIAPVLGVCYGMQLIASQEGGKTHGCSRREYGLSEIVWEQPFGGLEETHQKVWMSHGDIVDKVPKDFKVMARSASGHIAAMASQRALCFQFHPEVSHTEKGLCLLKHFAFSICQAQPNWRDEDILKESLQTIKAQVGPKESVLCALSGGVDSTVVATLLTQALGPEKVFCVFVNNGLLRKDEFQSVLKLYSSLGLNVEGLSQEEAFLRALKGVTEPEKKRKIIGHLFIEIFEKFLKNMSSSQKPQYLAQGTLYTDRIESVSIYGQNVTIKSHHNVGGLPKNLKLQLVEPLKELFKDEVRILGEKLGLDSKILKRHPFPGPGLAVRILGEVTEESLKIVREADAIFIEELKKQNLYDEIWQAFCVLLPVKTVGVQGDFRTYERVLALRAVTSQDGMTADSFEFPPKVLKGIATRIINDVKGINRVVYDLTSKPPGTIEWE